MERKTAQETTIRDQSCNKLHHNQMIYYRTTSHSLKLEETVIFYQNTHTHCFHKQQLTNSKSMLQYLWIIGVTIKMDYCINYKTVAKAKLNCEKTTHIFAKKHPSKTYQDPGKANVTVKHTPILFSQKIHNPRISTTLRHSVANASFL